MTSIFSRIVNGEIPAFKLAENEHFLAFLDINPIAKGHALVIPKEEIDYLFNIPDLLLADLFVFSKNVALAIEKVIPCKRIGVAVVGLEVPHAHVHLVPLQTIYDIDFKKPKLKFSQEELHEIAGKISQAYQAMES
ncbi:MAG: HIT family protein [Bacteroidales bacterium]|nr:HIT family protein [Bacteroidales bacterium]